MKKVILWVSISFAVVCFIGIIMMSKIYGDIKETADNVYLPLEKEVSPMRDEPIDVKNLEPFSMLVLGVDEREEDGGRSDTIIVLTVNPNQNSTYMLSIPRDTYTEIIGKNIKDKINHAYAFGGIEMSLRTVENLLNIPIDYAAQVNMEGFVEIVDVVGGITVDNSLAFDYEGETFPVGKLKLDGDKALKFVRMRYEDPNGDFGRQNRQKQVIKGVLNEAVSVNIILKYDSILKLLEKNVAMNMNISDIYNIQKKYSSSLKNVEQLYLTNGTGTMMNSIYYYIIDENELAVVQSTLQQHLEVTN